MPHCLSGLWQLDSIYNQKEDQIIKYTAMKAILRISMLLACMVPVLLCADTIEGNLTIKGYDLVFGYQDGRNQGPARPWQRALVHTGSDGLYINYSGDFEGGTYFHGPKVIFAGPKVGIGTYNPTNALDVNGTIRAKEIKVQSGWSDFVFEKDYRLAPLSEVEEFINAHGHLPGVPTEAEISEEGLSVGEAQAFMMQKIEELTLHMINLEKVNEELHEEIHRLKYGKNDDQ